MQCSNSSKCLDSQYTIWQIRSWQQALRLEGYKCKKGHFISSVNWFVGNFRGKVPIECYIRLFQSYCSTHYGSILWPLHDRGFNDFCVTWNKGVRRMLEAQWLSGRMPDSRSRERRHESPTHWRRWWRLVLALLRHDKTKSLYLYFAINRDLFYLFI